MNSQPENICFFNTTTFWGGGEKWHYEAAVMASEQGIPTFFVSSPHSVLNEKLASTKVRQFPIRNSKLGFLSVAKVKKLTQFFKDNKITTVVFNSPVDLKTGGLAAYMAKVPTVVYRRGIAVEVKKKTLTTWLFKKVITHFIFNSAATKALMVKNFEDIINTKKTAIIYNAIDFSAFTKTEKTNSSPTIIIGNAGRLVTQKAQHYLVDIASILKAKNITFEIHIAGDGPRHNELKALIEANQLENQVKLLGFVKDMNEFMNNIDIFVSTAKWEGFGFVLAEAMAHQLPCIAFDISSNPELIHNNTTGFLVPAFDVKVFARQIEKLINDKTLRHEMGNKAYQFAINNFDKKLQFNTFLEFVKG